MTSSVFTLFTLITLLIFLPQKAILQTYVTNYEICGEIGNSNFIVYLQQNIRQNLIRMLEHIKDEKQRWEDTVKPKTYDVIRVFRDIETALRYVIYDILGHLEISLTETDDSLLGPSGPELEDKQGDFLEKISFDIFAILEEAKIAADVENNLMEKLANIQDKLELILREIQIIMLKCNWREIFQDFSFNVRIMKNLRNAKNELK